LIHLNELLRLDTDKRNTASELQNWVNAMTLMIIVLRHDIGFLLARVRTMLISDIYLSWYCNILFVIVIVVINMHVVIFLSLLTGFSSASHRVHNISYFSFSSIMDCVILGFAYRVSSRELYIWIQVV